MCANICAALCPQCADQMPSTRRPSCCARHALPLRAERCVVHESSVVSSLPDPSRPARGRRSLAEGCVPFGGAGLVSGAGSKAVPGFGKTVQSGYCRLGRAVGGIKRVTGPQAHPHTEEGLPCPLPWGRRCKQAAPRSPGAARAADPSRRGKWCASPRAAAESSGG